MKHRNLAAISAVGAIALCVSLSAPAWAASNDQENAEAVSLLVAAQPALADSIVAAATDSTERQGVEVTVAQNVVTLDSNEGAISVEAPAATSSSSVTPVLLENAEALFAIQLDRADAPTEYDFRVDLPGGGTHEFLENGGLIFKNDAGEYIGGVAPPWAKDVNGNQVPTWFTYENHTLTQHVDTAGLDASAFPVIADPYMGKWLISAAWVTSQGGSDYVINATPTQYGRDLGSQGGSAYFSYHLADLKSRLGSNASLINESIENQFYCNVAFNKQGGGETYNLESWRPSHGWNSLPQIWTHCNP